MTKLSFGEKIRKIRELKQITQEELGKKCSFNKSRIGHYENSIRIPKNEQLEKIAKALDVDIWALKDIDFDSTNFESTRQLLFLLEEKGLLSIDNLNVSLQYKDNIPLFSVEVPISETLASTLIDWQYLKERIECGELREEKFDLWKYNISPILPYNVYDKVDRFRDCITTKKLLDLDAVEMKDALELIEQRKFNTDDLERLLMLLNIDTSFEKKSTEYKRLVNIFINGIVSDKLQYELFELIPEGWLCAKFARGIVREAYNEAKELKKQK